MFWIHLEKQQQHQSKNMKWQTPGTICEYLSKVGVPLQRYTFQVFHYVGTHTSDKNEDEKTTEQLQEKNILQE